MVNINRWLGDSATVPPRYLGRDRIEILNRDNLHMPGDELRIFEAWQLTHRSGSPLMMQAVFSLIFTGRSHGSSRSVVA
jgi:hypothetical protein